MNEQTKAESEGVDNNLSVVTKAELDQLITTAKSYPRSVKKFIDEATTLATLTEEIASDCFYVLPDRNGKSIEGPNARLAEIIFSCWGNCRSASRIVAEESNFIIAQGVFHDLEHHAHMTREVKRRITYKDGGRYNDDMIAITGNAACSIALRNAIFAGIPKAFWNSIYKKARHVALGDVTTIASRRTNAIKYWSMFGITPENICEILKVKGMEDVGQEELLILRGYANAVKDGDMTPDSIFKNGGSSTTQSKETADLNDKLKKQADKNKDDQAETVAEIINDDANEVTVIDAITKVLSLKKDSQKSKLTQKAKDKMLVECDEIEDFISDILEGEKLDKHLTIISEIRPTLLSSETSK